MGFKSISQTNIKKNDGFVTLSDRVARKVITDLIHYDICSEITRQQQQRIEIFQKKEIAFKNDLSIKDSIIQNQKEYIDIQKNLLNNKKSFEIHGYAGVQSVQFTLNKPTVYTNLMFEFTRFNIGAQYYAQISNHTGYGIILEYKLF